jgi:hypothetical protein
MGIEDNMTRVRDHERERARTRHVTKVEKNWTSVPVLTEVAMRTSSMSLEEERERQ